MTQIKVNNEEAQVIAVYRAIRDLDNPFLVSAADVGDVVEALRAVVDLEAKEKELSADSLKALIFGFVSGMGATKLPDLYQAQAEQEAAARYYGPPEDETHYTAPTGGVAVGQGEDPKYVKQTGVTPEPAIVE